MIEEIKEYWEDDQATRVPETQNWPANSKDKIFVIHGHDKSTCDAVARFLTKLSLKPMILHEHPNEGRTIIEKFENYADVRFAVVLLTPDDKGTAAQTIADELKPRARQNVIFEFGYFIGKLGRKRVCALVKDDIEKPSDLNGILYIVLDDGDGWRIQLLKELKAAGFNIDANQAL